VLFCASPLRAQVAASGVASAAIDDGAAITPAVAESLYARLSPLHEPDGCRVARLDTSRFRITVTVQARSGAAHSLGLATAAQQGGAVRRAGSWALSGWPDLERDCPATLAAVEHVLSAEEAPRELRRGPGRSMTGLVPYPLLEGSFVLLVLGTLRLLTREAARKRPPPLAAAALALVSGVALALRLGLSPHTFLHEYYHVAETLSAYLTGQLAPVYGNAGPALFRLVGTVLGRNADVGVIFDTNAVVSALAIPAVALLDLALVGSWPRAICAGTLLCILPQHLRLSAAEDLFVQALTLGLWSLATFAVYLRTRRLDDALLAALALSLAMQTRPEMLFFPAVVVAMVPVAGARAWRVLLSWRTVLAALALAALLVPRLLTLPHALADTASHGRAPAIAGGYLRSLELFQSSITPGSYWVLLAVGLAWGVARRPGLMLWVLGVFVAGTLMSLSVFNNPIYNLRSQLLPTCLTVMIAAGAAPVWMGLWGRRRRASLALGGLALAALGVIVVTTWRGFVTRLADQQLEWSFLERAVPQLPEKGTLLSAIEAGGDRLDVFPDLLLSRAGKSYQLLDVRQAARDGGWPTAGGGPEGSLIYYQGMFCYFAMGDEPTPDPLTEPCRAVQTRYQAEPLIVDDIVAPGYSTLRYAQGGQGPFRIGFFRLTSWP
jgi:hypothetical protein